jgi:hypothetical protein
VIDTLPPELKEEEPAAKMRNPPTPLFPLPTVIVICPPLPEVAEPEPI